MPMEIRSNREFQVKVLHELNPILADLPSTSIEIVKKQQGRKNELFKTLKKTAACIPILSNIGKSITHSRVAHLPEDSYVRPNDWLRSDANFREFFLHKLAKFKKRSIVCSKEVDKLVADHLNNKRNHMKTLSSLVDLELFFELFVDGKGFDG